MQEVHAIVFSKDRAWQLAQLLRSLEVHVQCRGLSISVLYTTSSPKKGTSPDAVRCTNASYADLMVDFPNVKFVREEVGKFGEQLLELLNQGGGSKITTPDSATGAAAAPLVMFLVDDLIVFDTLNLDAVSRLLQARPSVWAYQPKLHPGIVWSHPAGKPCARPPLRWAPLPPPTPPLPPSPSPPSRSPPVLSSEPVPSPSAPKKSSTKHLDHSDGFAESATVEAAAAAPGSHGACMVFQRGQGSGDWNYPWDLCGSVYRHTDAMAVISAAVERFGANAIANPNKLEAYGARICTQAQASVDKQLEEERAAATTPTPPSSSSSSSSNSPNSSVGTERSSSPSSKSASSLASPPESIHRRHLEALLHRSSLMACPEEACVAVVTVNVVQRTYKVPIYTSPVVRLRHGNTSLLPPSAPPLATNNAGTPAPLLSPRPSTSLTTLETPEVKLEPQETAAAAAGDMAEFPAMDGSVESLEKLRRWRPATSDAAVDSSSTSDASNQDGVVDSSDVSSKADALALGYGSGCVELDFDAYKRLRRSQCSVHVGDLHLQLNLNRKGGTEGNSDSNNEGDSRRRSALQDDDDAEATAAAAVEDINSEIADVGSTPLVTVLMPCFNGAAFVGRAVRSVLDQAQDFEHDLELLVIDDGSQDGSATVARAAGRGDPRLHVVARAENRGLIETLSEGLALARGSIVVRLDADDVCAPQRIHRQLSALTDAGQNLVAIGGAVTLFTEEADHLDGDERGNENDKADNDGAKSGLERESYDGTAIRSNDVTSGTGNGSDVGDKSLEGTAAATAAPSASSSSNQKKPPWRSLRRTVVHPSEPLLVKWGLWWSCCVAHPAVAMRRCYDVATGPTATAAPATANTATVNTATATVTADIAAAGTSATTLDSSMVAPCPVTTTNSTANPTSNSTTTTSGVLTTPHRRRVRIAYRPSAEGAEDYDLWFRLSATTGGVANLPSVVTHHRRHGRNATVTLRLSPHGVEATTIPKTFGVAGAADTSLHTTAADDEGVGAAGFDCEGDASSERSNSSVKVGSGYLNGDTTTTVAEVEIDDIGPKILSPAEAAAEWMAGTEDHAATPTNAAAAASITSATKATADPVVWGPLAERGKSAALRVATAHMAAALSSTTTVTEPERESSCSGLDRSSEGRGSVSLRAAACARDPAEAAAWGATPKDFMAAANLILALEKATLGSAPCTVGSAAGTGVQPPPAYESPWARSVLTADCTARIGELALAAMATHGSDVSPVWDTWAKRAGPEAQVAALRDLLGGSGK